MARFFFHLHECGVVTYDDEGREFVDGFAALIAARHDARSVMASEVLDGHLCLSCHIEVVHGETGERVEMPFRNALTISGG